MQVSNQTPCRDSHPNSLDLEEAPKYYQTAKGLVIKNLDTIDPYPSFLVAFDDHQFRVNQRCIDALEFFHKPRTSEEFSQFWAASSAKTRSQKNSHYETLQKLLDSGMIQSLGNVSSTKRRIRTHLRLRLDILSPHKLEPITAVLSQLFSWPTWLICGIFVVAVHVIMLASMSGLVHTDTNKSNWWMLIIIIYTSLFIHELGHLSACRFFGAKHGALGCGLFFVYPVLYADVTDCWSLNRYQRAVVDLGGIMFQLLFGSLVAIVGLAFDSILAYGAVLSILFCALINLNPFFRLDGYWFLNDIAGLTSLEQMRNDLFVYYWRRLLRIKTSVPEILFLPVWLRSIVVFYGLACIGFILHLFDILIRILPTRVNLVFGKIETLYRLALEGHGTDLLNLIAVTLLALFSLLLILRMVYRLSRRIVRGVLFSPPAAFKQPHK